MTYQAESKSWQRHRSPLAVAMALVLLIIIAYASLYPLSGWNDDGTPVWAYVFAPINWHLYKFDFVINILGYVPFGFLLVLAMYPRPRGLWALLAATLLGTLVSGSMEALQTFLPTRTSSNIDLLTNIAGTMVGATLALPLASKLIDRGWLRRLRLSWFEPGHSMHLTIALIWPFAQLYPQAYLFGNGGVLRDIILALYQSITGKQQAEGITREVLNWLDLSYWLQDSTPNHADLHRLGEFAITSSAVFGAAMFCMCLAKPRAPARLLIAVALTATILLKCLVVTSQFSFADMLGWATPGAMAGILMGITLAFVACIAGPRQRRFWAWLGLLVQLLLCNLMPPNPFYEAMIDAWHQGKLIHFNQLALWVSMLWPYLAVLCLLVSLDKRVDKIHILHRGMKV